MPRSTKAQLRDRIRKSTLAQRKALKQSHPEFDSILTRALSHAEDGDFTLDELERIDAALVTSRLAPDADSTLHIGVVVVVCLVVAFVGWRMGSSGAVGQPQTPPSSSCQVVPIASPTLVGLEANNAAVGLARAPRQLPVEPRIAVQGSRANFDEFVRTLRLTLPAAQFVAPSVDSLKSFEESLGRIQPGCSVVVVASLEDCVVEVADALKSVFETGSTLSRVQTDRRMMFVTYLPSEGYPSTIPHRVRHMLRRVDLG